jgi:phosphoenolpyruvate phosphomutase
MPLRERLGQTGQILKLVGAHNPLGARLAQQAGFDGVWASGFEIATSRGLPDSDVVSWPELLSAAKAMADAVDLPVVSDCGTGFGGPPVVREMVGAYAAAGMAGICLEDGAAPRRNSLLPGAHGLADVRDFAAKIEAAVTAGQGLVVLARVQALVAATGPRDALARARAYADAGADAIVIHSRSPEPTEVLDFVAAWDRSTPVVLIPTTYHKLTVAQMRSSGKVRMAIYANHGLRAAIFAMKQAFRQIIEEETTHGVETWIASLEEAFELQADPKGGTNS